MRKPEELTETEKKRRAQSGELILIDYMKRSGDKGLSEEEVLTDVLSNLMHYWAHRKKRGSSTFTKVYERSVDHTQIELGFEQEFGSFAHMIESECDCSWNSKKPGPEHNEGCRRYETR